MSRSYLAHLWLTAAMVLCVCLCSNVHAQTTQPVQSHDQDQEKIGTFIQKGDWKGAKAVAEAWAKDEPKASIALFVVDAAGLMTKTRDHPIRTTADFPYSDKDTCDKILAWTQDLLVQDPKNTNFMMLNGVFYVIGRQDFTRGLDRFEKTLESDPNNVIALTLVGAGYGASNRLDDAVRLSNKAIQLDSDCEHAYYNLGMVAQTRGDLDKALDYYKKATACTDADGMDWFAVGSVDLAQGHQDEAKAALLKAVDVSPNLYQPHWNLASVYYSLHQMDDCIRECKKVVELAPDSVEGQKAKRNLQALGQ